ncbi:Uncharacterised protein [Mycobacteroides abscessus subsp. abscessus]|nr:Uncharacterised protein [Mycobacteroides abscessus subsp. abscessus]SKF62879.1 Uncharacterised protein [Mycobacteroides abscessus subsp. bolletii]SKU26575.1 Uncharacterised protein [Mycobacteroides abscessus subsp. abscessus]SKV62955.1 Uncharacterised protein [Mycobacteroides abscessus subsp. abscessus]
MASMATSTLMTLAGRWRAWGSLAATTFPVFRSAMSHDSAEMSLGTGPAPSGVITSQRPSISPPMGLAGTGSGAGGSPPALGTSEVSTAGGVTTL